MKSERSTRRKNARHVLTADEMARLVRSCSPRSSSGIRNRALIATIYRCGLRVSEIIALDAEHVDRDTRSIHVPGSRSRVIEMDAGSFWLVECWIERRKEVGLDSTPALYSTLQGSRLCASYIRALLPRLARKAGIDKRVSTEVIRRTLAVELAREGHPIHRIQAQLGHGSPDTTNRYLAHAASLEDDGTRVRRSSWRP